MNNDVKPRKKAVSKGAPEPADQPLEENRSISWEAPEYVFFEKGADWYWMLGIIVVALAVVGVLLDNVLFSLFVILAGFTIVILGVKKPETHRYEINERGIKIENELYPFPTLDFFWIDEDGPQTVLLVESKKIAVRHIVIPLEGIRSDDVRFFLEEFVPEEFIERPWSQKIMERVGF